MFRVVLWSNEMRCYKYWINANRVFVQIPRYLTCFMEPGWCLNDGPVQCLYDERIFSKNKASSWISTRRRIFAADDFVNIAVKGDNQTIDLFWRTVLFGECYAEDQACALWCCQLWQFPDGARYCMWDWVSHKNSLSTQTVFKNLVQALQRPGSPDTGSSAWEPVAYWTGLTHVV